MLNLFDFKNGLFYSCSAWETANRAYMNNKHGKIFFQLFFPKFFWGLGTLGLLVGLPLGGKKLPKMIFFWFQIFFPNRFFLV